MLNCMKADWMKGTTNLAIGDFSSSKSKSLGVGRGAQTEEHYFPKEVTKVDKGIEVKRGRRHNQAPTVFMNNGSQTDIERHRYSLFVVVFIIVALLNVWYAYVSLNIHYKLHAPVSQVEEQNKWYYYVVSVFKHIVPNGIVRLFTWK